MSQSKKIALIQGGMGAEAKISEMTGAAFAQALVELGYDYEVVSADQELPATLLKMKPDVALLAVHGKFAEDGTVQGICEYLKIPYTGAGVLSSALCMDKYFSKQIYVQNEIPTPAYQIVDAQIDDLDKVKCDLPGAIVVKPSREGSSVGISILEDQSGFVAALKEAAKYDRYILVEEFIAGKEVTVPVLGGKALTAIEIEPKDGFYDYENKYTAGKTNYILPARLSAEATKKIQELALKTCEICRIRAYSRVDFRVDENENPFVMEVNTLPGCTQTSLVPQAAAYDGIKFSEVIDTLIKEATLDYAGVR